MTTTLVIRNVRAVSDGVTEIELADPDGRQLATWTPGAHIDVVIKPELVRQYSLCSSPTDRDSYRIAVLREPQSRGGSEYLCEQLAAGDELVVEGPRNHFELLPAARYIFIAGGIGITPIIEMIRTAQRTGADWRLLYGGRTRNSMAYRDELFALDPDRVVLQPQDEFGLLDLDAVLAEPQPDTLIYCCGPEPLLQAVEARSAHWPSGALRVERFAPKAMAEPVLAGSFEIELAESGMTLTVPPDQSILEVVDEAGVFVLSNCQEGTCGTCETRVLGGIPDHRDSILDDEERASNEVMMICVSRSRTERLVLEL